VVGAGPAGCELAGSLIELMHRAVQREFKQLPQKLCKVILVDVWIGCCPPWLPNFPPLRVATWRGRGWI
jgi:NADH dehydrogenase